MTFEITRSNCFLSGSADKNFINFYVHALLLLSLRPEVQRRRKYFRFLSLEKMRAISINQKVCKEEISEFLTKNWIWIENLWLWALKEIAKKIYDWMNDVKQNRICLTFKVKEWHWSVEDLDSASNISCQVFQKNYYLHCCKRVGDRIVVTTFFLVFSLCIVLLVVNFCSLKLYIPRAFVSTCRSNSYESVDDVTCLRRDRPQTRK